MQFQSLEVVVLLPRCWLHRTPDGRLAILDFGLMTEVDDEIKFGMIEVGSRLLMQGFSLT
jgi:hypothetical protein